MEEPPIRYDTVSRTHDPNIRHKWRKSNYIRFVTFCLTNSGYNFFLACVAECKNITSYNRLANFTLCEINK